MLKVAGIGLVNQGRPERTRGKEIASSGASDEQRFARRVAWQLQGVAEQVPSSRSSNAASHLLQLPLTQTGLPEEVPMLSGLPSCRPEHQVPLLCALLLSLNVRAAKMLERLAAC